MKITDNIYVINFNCPTYTTIGQTSVKRELEFNLFCHNYYLRGTYFWIFYSDYFACVA